MGDYRYALEQHEANNRKRIEEALWDKYKEEILDEFQSEYWELVDFDLRESKEN